MGLILSLTVQNFAFVGVKCVMDRREKKRMKKLAEKRQLWEEQ